MNQSFPSSLGILLHIMSVYFCHEKNGRTIRPHLYIS
jgi:hypothetical protein